MSGIANCYAEALYALAKEDDARADILDDTQKLARAMETTPLFLRVLSSGGISSEEKHALLDSCFLNRAHTYVLSCLKLMCDKDDIKLFPVVCSRIRQLYNDEMGILAVTVTSARRLTDDQMRRLCEQLEKITSRKVELTNVVDGECIGGLRLEYGGLSIDDTIRHRLENIKKLVHAAGI